MLGGSEGKITINTHKAALLSAAGSLTNIGVTGGAMAALANNATNHFLKILETKVYIYVNLNNQVFKCFHCQVHEGTLVTALEI